MTSVTPAPPAYSAPSPSADPLIGATLGGRYTIRRLIGAGGMGLVYLADQAGKPREVVVKVLAPHWLNDDAAKRRFDREAQALSSLRHPNIVEMFDFGREGDRAYLVMEFLIGVPLSKYLRDRPILPLPEFVPIAAQILKGTGYAHSREVVVRDIKPGNVMLCERQGRANYVKMLDFGLAKLVHDENPITQDQTLGTLGYIAPETVAGHDPDLRVDVYALGVLFYQMLCGRLPFDDQSGNSAAMLYQTVHNEPTPLTELLPYGHDIPEGLIDLVHCCLRKVPDSRPADANVLVEQMIDVVPAAMFRLPSAPSHAGRPSESASAMNVLGNSSLLERPPPPGSMGGSMSGPMGSFDALDGVTIQRPSTTAPSPYTPPFGVYPPTATATATATTAAPVASAPPSTGSKLTLLAGLLLGCAGTAVAFVAKCGGDDPPPAVVAEVSTPASAASATPAASSPGAAAGVAPAPEAADPPLGSVVISSTPEAAKVVLDGELVGVTPYSGKATLGTHSLTVEAPGYHRWSSQIEVAVEATDPLVVSLVRDEVRSKRRRGSSGTRSKPRAPDDEAPSSPPPAAKPAKPTKPTKPAKSTTAPSNDSLLSDKKRSSSTLLPSNSKKKSDALLRSND
ncbi:MAG: serine/threonine-protein kinase [Myxococcota bacterium]